jgi:hypothetical protein
MRTAHEIMKELELQIDALTRTPRERHITIRATSGTTFGCFGHLGNG